MLFAKPGISDGELVVEWRVVDRKEQGRTFTFSLTLIHTLRFFKAGKEMFHDDEKDRHEVNSQHRCCKHPPP